MNSTILSPVISKSLNGSISPTDGTLTGTTIPGQSGPGSTGSIVEWSGYPSAEM